MEQHSEHQEVKKEVFRIAYKQANNCRPISDFGDEIDVQIANGVTLGRIVHTNASSAYTIDHIGQEMRKTMCRATIEVFLDLVEAVDATATGIKDSLLTCLQSHGVTVDVLKDKLIAFASDGASVMLGKQSGVAKLLEDSFPHLITWYCFAHRLELAVGDSVRDVEGINHFKIFMDKLYCLYSSSPKNRRELESCARDLNTSLLRLGKVLDTRYSMILLAVVDHRYCFRYVNVGAPGRCHDAVYVRSIMAV
ncbi:hypothetical protein MTO96_037332 [Rhipicephalus appendiculatus]